MKRILLIAAAALFTFSAMSAQDNTQGQDKGQRPKVSTSKERAQRQADRLKDELKLSDKQYKKVYKAFLSQEKEMEGMMSQGNQGGQRPEGMGGQPPQGMGPGGMGGQRPQGMGPGMGGQRPQNMDGQMPEGMKDRADKMKNVREKTDKKLKQILSEDQYVLYQKHQEKMQKERQQRGPGNGQRPQGAPQQTRQTN